MKKEFFTRHFIFLTVTLLTALLLVACINDGDSAIPSSEGNSSEASSSVTLLSSSANATSSNSSEENKACAVNINETTVLCVEADAMTEALCDSSASDYEDDSITVESMSSCPSNETKTCEESSMTYYVYADSSYDYCALFEAIE